MQISRFSTGGFVVHKLEGHISAWFDACGKLLDMETRDRLGRSRPVKHDGPTWRRVADWGRSFVRYANARRET